MRAVSPTRRAERRRARSSPANGCRRSERRSRAASARRCRGLRASGDAPRGGRAAHGGHARTRPDVFPARRVVKVASRDRSRRSRAPCDGEGFFERRRRRSRRRRLPRLRPLGADPPHRHAAAARAVPAPARRPSASVRRGRAGPSLQHSVAWSVGRWERSWSDADYAAADRGRSRRDRGRRRLPGEPRPAPLGAVPRRPGCARGRARAAAPAAPRPLVGDGWAIVSASPELFLAPPRPARLDDADQGHASAGRAGLAESEKDAAEHVMIVDLERNDLARVCEPGSVRWPELMAPARARGRRAPRLDGSRASARGRRADRAPGARPSPAAR